MKVALTDIKVAPRQREEMESDDYPIHKLASSIRSTKGLVQRIVVNDQLELIAGERRLRALELLVETHPDEPWAEVDVDVRPNIDDDLRYLMEFEENLHRKPLTPREYNSALNEFHTRQTANNPEQMKGPVADPTAKPRWTQQDTAEVMGVSRGLIAKDLATASVMEMLPEEVQAEIYELAGDSKQAVERELERRINRAGRDAGVKKRAEEEALMPAEDGREEIRLIDAVEGMKEMASASVDLIITDPPYGQLVGSAGEKGLGHAIYDDRNFTDDSEEVFEMLSRAIPEMYRVMRPGCHLYMFCGLSWRHKTSFYSLAQLCADAGFFVRTMPLIWCKDVQGFKPPFTHWPLAYEPIIFATTGKRDTENIPRGDWLMHKPIPGPSKDHRFQKPISLIHDLMRVSMVPDGNLLDPFCGGGSILLAARKRWMRVQGFDADQESIFTARDKIATWDREVLDSNPTQGEQMLMNVKRWRND